jgi:hypothetical protein
MPSKLDLIEAHLRSWIENSLHLLPGWDQQEMLAGRLLAAMSESVSTEDGFLCAPGAYVISLNPESLQEWQTGNELASALELALQNAAQEAGVILKSAPSIQITADPQLAPNVFHVFSREKESAAEQTSALPVVEALQPDNTHVHSINTFLILDNSDIFPLNKTVVNIGRRPENDLQIIDPRISRNHAQLRSAHGHYQIFDLNSTGGTYVNGQRVTQHALKPGDVISLAGVLLIYGEDYTSAVHQTSEIKA